MSDNGLTDARIVKATFQTVSVLCNYLSKLNCTLIFKLKPLLEKMIRKGLQLFRLTTINILIDIRSNSQFFNLLLRYWLGPQLLNLPLFLRRIRWTLISFPRIRLSSGLFFTNFYITATPQIHVSEIPKRHT